MAPILLGLFALLAAPAVADLFPDCVNGPLKNNTICNTKASVDDRAQALINALHIDEKFNLTGNNSPGVPRLGLHSYQWWRTSIPTITYAAY
jgi:beta-D-xylosidase 4